MRSARIKQMLADEDFQAMIDAVRQSLVKEVMAKKTDEARRSEALAEYHALDSLIAKMRSSAHDAKPE